MLLYDTQYIKIQLITNLNECGFFAGNNNSTTTNSTTTLRGLVTFYSC